MGKNVAQLNMEPPDDNQDEEELDAEQYREELANQELVDKGCHRQGIMNAWKRHSKPKRQQSKIDATFKVACELVGGQGDLFGAD